MRSPAEILFRLRQEAANLAIYLSPPKCPVTPRRLPWPQLPPVTREYTVPEIPVAWRRDPVSLVESPLRYFRRIPYLDPVQAGDHKKIWDLNRCQELAVLSSQGKAETVQRLLADWLRDNPVHRGMNWTSALEVAFRALSWLYIWHRHPQQVPPEFLDALYAHGVHLFYNLSIYFSPNTHLLGEAVALHALGLFFGQESWRREGRRVVSDCLRRQVFADGAYFEQSSYYHVYALDFFLLHHQLEALPTQDFAIVERMGLFLAALLGQAEELPFLGDDDGGRLYHPFDEHARFGRDTLRRLWPKGVPEAPPLFFPETGLIFLSNNETQILFDAGPMARGSAGHSHSDALSVLARLPDEEILIDPGTFTYVADLTLRNLFRSSAMHNTVRINQLDQATPQGPFRWTDLPVVRLVAQSLNTASAECLHFGFTHRRTLNWDPSARQLHIEDEINGPPGLHQVEQHWHFASAAASQRLRCQDHAGFALEPRPSLSFRSRAFDRREAAPCLAFSGQSSLPLHLRATLDLTPNAKIRT